MIPSTLCSLIPYPSPLVMSPPLPTRRWTGSRLATPISSSLICQGWPRRMSRERKSISELHSDVVHVPIVELKSCVRVVLWQIQTPTRKKELCGHLELEILIGPAQILVSYKPQAFLVLALMEEA
ncbi:hypothetical protein GOP47_0005384 [Adiantum capillus-veneris]|uniref:Uncharacterized protein n=1 Tax=Adiantum capillus-veneris TaxID=13818 RepID=A0A9D4V500_ADICA|nr:hypothetical protein GOP47_0005384 [Adiantum capillus-veneris]